MNIEERLRSYERVYAEVDLDAIRCNMDRMKANIALQTRMIAVIKADGYGHGSVPIARELEPLPYLFGFATATFEEAQILRKSGVKKPILVLGYTFPYCYGELIRQEIRTALFRMDAAVRLSEEAVSTGREALVHIKVDTGMSRIGIRPDDEGLRFVREVSGLPGIRIEGIFTHFAKADWADQSEAVRQCRIFGAFTERIERELALHIPLRHCSNSAGIIRIPEANMDLVRAGITMYGLWPSEEVERDIVSLTPALSLKSHIVYVKDMEEGMEISYGGTFRAGKGMKIATIPVGYADGYPRSLSNKGCVLIRGQRARIAGRVCMDQMMVDVTEIPQAKEGDVVTLLGTDGGETISAEELGDLSGRFNYELVCDISKRVPRVYRKGPLITAVKDYYDDFEYLPEKRQ
ncbi:alanine racemase [Lachnospiraceae bacterium JLR.KK008]